MFYRAVVEENIDPSKIGRVRVRIFGFHDENASTSELPWAEVAGGTEFGLVSGVGISSVLRKGTVVWVFFKEDDSNYPVVFATVKGNNTKSPSAIFGDPDGVYPKRMGSDLHPNAQSSYGDIATLETASGHLIELDDSVGNERIKLTHKTGSSIFIDKDGNIFVKSVKNIEYNIVENAKWIIGGKLDIETEGPTTLSSGGSLNMTSPDTTMSSPGNFTISGDTINLN